MELISGFLLWTADVMGVKWVRGEQNKFKKVLKGLTFLIAGIILVMLYFVVWYS